MANHKSAIKRNRQSEKKRVRNASVKSHVKTRIKAVLKAVEEKDPSQSLASLQTAISIIDKASSKGILHKNNAARKISRLTRHVNALAGVSKS